MGKLQAGKTLLNAEVLTIKRLTKSFNNSIVLNGIDMTVYNGENVIVLGPSGSGKSVLFKIITGFMQPDAGIVEVMGSNLSNLPLNQLRDLRKKIGMSFQNSALYDSMTVWDNMKFALTRHFKNMSKNELEIRIMDMLHMVGLAHATNYLPSDLSGGQRKRIGIARALVLEPELMLYDEPTAGLDPVTSAEINDLINHIQRTFNTTSLIITHDLTCAKNTGHRLFMMYQGKFIREGSFAEVFLSGDDRIKPFYNYKFTD
ncbi:MAG: ABC transporter ATP-binding protein [Bacteroidota bacterium]